MLDVSCADFPPPEIQELHNTHPPDKLTGKFPCNRPSESVHFQNPAQNDPRCTIIAGHFRVIVSWPTQRSILGGPTWTFRVVPGGKFHFHPKGPRQIPGNVAGFGFVFRARTNKIITLLNLTRVYLQCFSSGLQCIGTGM